MAPGLIPSNTGITYTGTGRSNRYFFYRGRKANLHGVLMVGSGLAVQRLGNRIKKWYKDHQLYIWYWLVFSVWITLGIMVGLMFYAMTS